MKIEVDFDEQPLIKALIDNVVAKIEDEFHKIFPRLRRDEIEAAMEPILRGDKNIRCNENIRPSAYLLKNNPEQKLHLGDEPTIPEGFYFYYNGDLIAYHVLETSSSSIPYVEPAGDFPVISNDKSDITEKRYYKDLEKINNLNNIFDCPKTLPPFYGCCST